MTKVIPKARYVVDEQEAEVVRQIFGWILTGWTTRAITIELTRRRISPQRSSAWCRSTVSKMLCDASYCGEGYAHKHKLVKVRRGGQMKKMVVPRPREEWVPYVEGVIPPIIDRATFEAAQAILKLNKQSEMRTCAIPENYLLRAGFVFCGFPGCGSTMIVETKRNEGRRTPAASYMCNKARHGTDLPIELRRPGMQKIAIRCRTLDDAVWDRLLFIVDNPEYLREQFAQLRATDPTELDLAAIDRRVKDVARRERNHFAAIEEEDDPDARAALRGPLEGSQRRARQAQERARGRPGQAQGVAGQPSATGRDRGLVL